MLNYRKNLFFRLIENSRILVFFMLASSSFIKLVTILCFSNNLPLSENCWLQHNSYNISFLEFIFLQ